VNVLPRAVIFDLDGTLLDTFPAIIAAWNAAMREALGREYGPEEVIARFGVPDVQMLEREWTGVPYETRAAAIETYFAAYVRAHDEVRPFEGIPELLGHLRERDIPLAIMTGKGRRAAEITLQHMGWENLFVDVVTGDDVLEQKPAPEGPLKAARTLKIEPNACVYVGDSPADISAGRSAGMFTVAAGWHTYYDAKLRASQPDVWAAHPADLLPLFP